MATITYQNSQHKRISPISEQILSKAGNASNNPLITITSTHRTPQSQAEAMFDNLKAGCTIAYAVPGRSVCEVYNANRSKPKEEVVRLMVARIIQLSLQGQRVSLHCVSDEEYAKRNIVDVTTKLPNPRDFVKALLKEQKVKRIITPYTSDYKDSRVSVDTKEPAIHIEIEP